MSTVRSPLRRRVATSTLGAALAGLVALGCYQKSVQSVGALADSKCPWKLDLANQPIELKEDVETLQSKYPGCLTEIATTQDVNGSAVNNQIQTNVPADPACGVTTSIQAGEYANAGLLDPNNYGSSGGGKRKGYIVAKIKNIGACATAGPLSIPPGVAVLWIVEVKKGEVAPKARLIFAGAENNLLGKVDWKILPCGHSGNAVDAAMIRFGKACQNLTLQMARDSMVAHPSMFPADAHRRLLDPPISLWMSCGGDCCYTDS